MENPLTDNSNDSDAGDKEQTAPVEQKSQEKGKKGLTIGRIIAIFLGLLVIGTVVGAVIYSQTAERFKGELQSDTRIESELDLELARITACPVGQKIQEFKLSATESRDLTAAPEPKTVSICICDNVDANGSEQLEYYNGTTCVPVDCDTNTQDAVSLYGAYLDEQIAENYNLTEDELKEIDTYLNAFDAELTRRINEYKDSPECEVIDPCPEGEYWVQTERIQGECQQLDCDFNERQRDNLIQSYELYRLSKETIEILENWEDSGWYKENCREEEPERITTTTLCPDDHYWVDVVGAPGECLPIDCDLTEIEVNRMLEDPASYRLTDNTIATLANWDTWYVDNCVEITEDRECTISITQPSNTSPYIIDSELADEELAFEVEGAEHIRNYEVSANSIVFTDPEGTQGATITTNARNGIMMNGGPAEGQTDSITVNAEILDVTGAVEATCSDSLRITREETPPDRERDPVCRSLTIVAPDDAVNGVPTATISEDGYINEDLRVIIDADPGAVDQIKYASDEGTITFDGQEPYWADSNTTSVKMNGGPNVGKSDTVSVWAVDASGQGIRACHDAFIVQVEEPPPDIDRDPVCRSLTIIAPPEAVNGVPTATISEDGYSSEPLRINIDADPGAVAQIKYESDEGTITFDDENPYWVDEDVNIVYMDGGPEAGKSDMVSVWAVDARRGGIDACHDAFIVQVEEPPPDIDRDPECPPCPEPDPCPPCPEPEPCPPCPEPDPCPEPEPLQLGEPTPEPTVPSEPGEPAPAPEPLHPAPEKQPETGPGVILYLVGAGIGGALLKKKKDRKQ